MVREFALCATLGSVGLSCGASSRGAIAPSESSPLVGADAGAGAGDASVPMWIREGPPLHENGPVSVSACRGQCVGRSTPGLAHAIAARAALAKECYDRALRDDHHLRGRSVVQVRIGPDGKACALGVAQSDMPEEMNECILRVFRGMDGPAPIGGCVDVTAPIAFVPAATDAGTRDASGSL
jgi:hypothetical protein